MITRHYRNTGIAASRLGRIRDYLNQQNSVSLGNGWAHKNWFYELGYNDGTAKCESFDEVAKMIKERGETIKHLTYFESQTGAQKLDATNPGEIVLTIENGRKTDAMLNRVVEIMSLNEIPRRVFITHGHGAIWREVADFIEKECNPSLPTIELASRANLGRTVIEKLDQEALHCGYAVVVMTGDDITEDGDMCAGENVVHEIGFFQGRYGAQPSLSAARGGR